MTKRLLRLAVVLAGWVMLTLPAQGMAETPFPVIHEPEGEGVECDIQPESEARRNHMEYILHKRDETMHKGIRTAKYGLARCIDCHVQPDESGHVASHDEDEHFCNACHQYAAVTIDCFECHADKPQKYIKRNQQTALQQQLEQTLLNTADAGKVGDSK